MKRSAKIFAVLLSVVLLVGVLATAVFAMQPTIKIGTTTNGIKTMYYYDFESYTGGKFTAKGDGQLGVNNPARHYNWSVSGAEDFSEGKFASILKRQSASYTNSADVNTYASYVRDASADSTYAKNYSSGTAKALTDFVTGGGSVATDGEEYLASYDFVTIDIDVCADQYIDQTTQDFVPANPDGSCPEGAEPGWYYGLALAVCYRHTGMSTWAGDGNGLGIYKDANGYFLAWSQSWENKYYLPDRINEWVHITWVVAVDNSSNADIKADATKAAIGNLDNTKMYCYVNGEYLFTVADPINKLSATTEVPAKKDMYGNMVPDVCVEALRINWGGSGRYNTTSFSFGVDNYSVNYYMGGYEGDLAEFNLGTKDANLYECDDVVFNDNYKFTSNKPVATVEDAEGNVEEFFFMSAALDAITEGSTVTLYEDSTETYTVDFEFSVITNGNEFKYTSTAYGGTIVDDPTDGETIVFTESTDLIPIYWDSFVGDEEYYGPFYNEDDLTEIANGNQIVYNGPTMVPVEGDPSKVYVLTGWTNEPGGDPITLPVANSEEASYYEFVAIYEVVDVCYSIEVDGNLTNYTSFDGYAANILALADGAVVNLYKQPEAIIANLASLITVNVADGVEFKFYSKTVTAVNVEGVYDFAAATEADMVTVNWLDSDNTTILSSETFAKGSTAVYTGSTTAFKRVKTGNGFYDYGFTAMNPVVLADPAVTYSAAPIMATPVEALEILVSVNTSTTIDMKWLVKVPGEELGVTDVKLAGEVRGTIDISNGIGDPNLYYAHVYGSPGASDCQRNETITITYKVNGVALSRNITITNYQYFDLVIRNEAATEAEKTFVANAIRYFDAVASKCVPDKYVASGGQVIAHQNYARAKAILADFASYLIDDSYENLSTNVFTEEELNVSIQPLKDYAPWITKAIFVTDNYDANYPTADQRGYRPRLAITYDVDALNAAHEADPTVPNTLSQSWNTPGLVLQNTYFDLQTGKQSASRTLAIRFMQPGYWYTDSGNQKLWNHRGVIVFRMGYSIGSGPSMEGVTMVQGTYSLAKNIVDTQTAGEDNTIQRALYAYSMASQQFKNS